MQTKPKTFPVPTAFINPYVNIEKSGSFARINQIVPPDFLDLLYTLKARPPGVVLTTTNILLTKFHNELVTRGITDSTQQSRFIELITRCRIVLPGEPNPAADDSAGTGNVQHGSATGSLPTATTPSIPRGTSSGCAETPGTPGEPHSVQSDSIGRRKGGKGVRTANTEGQSV